MTKTTDGVLTKYVYGKGLIGEECAGVYKTYHFDYRGSTVAITDICGKGLYTKSELLSRIRTSLAGRASEIVHYGTEEGISTGASGDLHSATKASVENGKELREK